MRLSQNVDYSTDLVMGYEVKNLITGNKLLQEVHLGRPPFITPVTDLVIEDANTFFGKKHRSDGGACAWKEGQ